MISKQYFETTFSIATAQALQAWANNNLIVEGFGDYAMKITWVDNGGASCFAETELTGLTIDDQYTMRLYMEDIFSNVFKISINSLPNDNTSSIAELAYGLGWREIIFTATAETMYLAIGDEIPTNTYSVVDNVTVKDNIGTNFVTNGTFEGNNTTGWYTQSVDAVLSVYDYVVEPPVIGDNPYVKPVEIPVYDAGNPEHFLIENVSQFNSSVLNSNSHKYIYVTPQDYSSQGKVTITTSGTAVQNRYLVLYSGDDLHPGQVASDADRANIALLIQADYWTISRMSSVDVDYSSDSTGGGTITIDKTSSYNIIDRLYSSNGGYPIRIKANARYNTIQKCYFDTPSAAASTQDNAHVMVADWGGDANGFYTTFNTLVLCEGKNYKMIKFHDANITPAPQFNGTIVDSNIIWYDEESKTDGSGNLDPLGEYCNVEADGIEFKSGSDNASERITVSNNIYFGARPIDPTFAPALGSQISMSTAYYGSYFIDYVGNMAFDAVSSIVWADSDNDSTYGTDGNTATENICQDMGWRQGASSDHSAGFRISDSHDFSVIDNLFKDPIDEYAYVWYNTSSGTSSFTGNSIVNIDESVRYLNNSPDIDGLVPTDNNDYLSTAEGNAIYTDDYTFTYQKYTNSPLQKTVSNVLKPGQTRPLNEA